MLSKGKKKPIYLDDLIVKVMYTNTALDNNLHKTKYIYINSVYAFLMGASELRG